MDGLLPFFCRRSSSVARVAARNSRLGFLHASKRGDSMAVAASCPICRATQYVGKEDKMECATCAAPLVALPLVRA